MSIATDIEAHRAHLVGVAYRITGSMADAEDAVQDAWLRLNRLSADERAAVVDPRAWLTTVVARLCLDRLRSATARRETYLGPWLPEPVVTPARPEDDPLDALVRDEDVRMAAMVVLERLSPPRRVAFVLREALELPYSDIATVLDCSPATARQHVARARQALAAAAPPPRAPAPEQARLLAELAAALRRGDTQAVVSLLHPDVVLVNDSGGLTPAARREVVGAAKVARLLVGLTHRFGPDLVGGWAPVLVNGDLGYRSGGRHGAPEAVTVFSVRDGRIGALYSVLNPAKLFVALGRTMRRAG